MGFDFEKIHQTYDAWYRGELKRPIWNLTFRRPMPQQKPDWFAPIRFRSFVDPDVSPKRLIDSMEYQLQYTEYAFEGFPTMPTMFFGPGFGAALMGCEAHGADDTVWFAPKNGEYIPIERLYVQYDDNNFWWNRLREVYREGSERFGGDVVLQMFDIGGILDVLASFVGTEQLLIDCVEQPEEVKRCVWEIQKNWFRYFDEINEILRPTAKGYSCWAAFLDREPSYIFQSDFSYMISPQMFRDFVYEELKDSTARVPHAFYHQDGVGQLPFTEMLLSIDTIRTVQWVPGDGEALNRDWTEHHRRILDSGRKLFVTYKDVDDYPGVYRQVGRPGDLYLTGGGDAADRERIIEKVQRDLEAYYAGENRG